MHTEQVRTLLRAFIHDLHPNEPEPVLPAESTLYDVGVDSMSLVDLLFTVEREFDITVSDEALPRITTVGDLVAYVTTRSTERTRERNGC
jgi:acyl carrier protein